MRTLLPLAALALVAATTVWAGTTLAGSGGSGGEATSYQVDLNVQEDRCGHDPFIWNQDPPPHNLTLQVVTQGANISIFGPMKWVEVHGVMEGNQFIATGTGTVANIPNVTVAFQGTLTPQSLTGKYAMGVQGELPPCGQPPAAHPAVYEVKPKPMTPTRTPTRTATPPEKLYKISVLKRNDDTKQGLPDFLFNLYATGNCSGNPIDFDFTDERGLIEFLVPAPGQYSVEEKLDPDDPFWNNVTPLCQKVTVAAGGAPAAGTIPDCPIPNGTFPDPGCDEFGSLATVKLILTNPDLGEFACDLSGPTQIVRNDVVLKPPDSIDTEIVFMKLTGTCEPGGTAVTLTLNPAQPSLGRIIEKQNSTPGVLEFPAQSYFDVFFRVTSALGTIHNQTAIRMACQITEIPPYGCFYEPPIGTVPLFNDAKKQVGVLVHAAHIPIDPKKTLVIFVNEPKVTATPTSTAPADATATRTPTATATPTATQPAGVVTATPTKTPQEQRTRHVTLRCVRPSPGVKVTGKATITEKKPGQPDRTVLQATCDSNTSPVVQTTYMISAGAMKNYRLAVTVAGRSNTCTFPGFMATQSVRISCTASPDGLELIETDALIEVGTGDVNKNGIINAIDAALALQSVAALIELDFPENADVDLDGDVDAIDVALTLQFVAGLVPGLPV
jgi:hypothetical protein